MGQWNIGAWDTATKFLQYVLWEKTGTVIAPKVAGVDDARLRE